MILAKDQRLKMTCGTHKIQVFVQSVDPEPGLVESDSVIIVEERDKIIQKVQAIISLPSTSGHRKEWVFFSNFSLGKRFSFLFLFDSQLIFCSSFSSLQPDT